MDSFRNLEIGMHNKKQKATYKGENGFNEYFLLQYKNRWEPIKYVLQKHDRQYVCVSNYSPYVHVNTCSIDRDDVIEHAVFEGGHNMFRYFLGAASFSVAELIYLHVNIFLKTAGCKILDMCAAPGGKIISLFSLLAQKNSIPTKDTPFSIYINDVSYTRTARLKHTILQYLSCNLFSSVDIKMITKNACLFGKTNKNEFDFIIVDAPCSSERYILQNKEALSSWNSARCKRDASKQTGLLCAALDACKIGGYVLYITCSLCERENSMLVDWVMQKRKCKCLPINIIKTPTGLEWNSITKNILTPEYTNRGEYTILPDLSYGSGPLFMALLQKQEN